MVVNNYGKKNKTLEGSRGQVVQGLRLYRFSTSVPGSNLVRPVFIEHEFSVFDWKAFSESVDLRKSSNALSEFSYTEQQKLSAKKRSTTYYNNYNV
jgi:hypothetical protein